MTDTVTIKGRYLRRHNLGNYEHQEAEVEFGGAHANEGALVVAEEMGRKAKMAVERILGLATISASGPVISAAQAEAYAAADVAKAEPKNPVGRPKGSTKKTEPAKPADDMPGFDNDAIADAGRTTDDKPAAKPTDDFDFVDPTPAVAKAETEEPVTDETLQTVASKAAATLGGADPIKKLMAENYKVKTLRDLEPYVRHAFVKDLAKLVADSKAKK